MNVRGNSVEITRSTREGLESGIWECECEMLYCLLCIIMIGAGK